MFIIFYHFLSFLSSLFIIYYCYLFIIVTNNFLSFFYVSCVYLCFYCRSGRQPSLSHGSQLYARVPVGPPLLDSDSHLISCGIRNVVLRLHGFCRSRYAPKDPNALLMMSSLLNEPSPSIRPSRCFGFSGCDFPQKNKQIIFCLKSIEHSMKKIRGINKHNTGERTASRTSHADY